MSLISCPEGVLRVSDQAAACPKCGATVGSGELVRDQPSMEEWALSRLSAGSPRRQIVDEIVQHGTMVRRDADVLVKRIEAGSLAPSPQGSGVKVAATISIALIVLTLILLFLRAAPGP